MDSDDDSDFVNPPWKRPRGTRTFPAKKRRKRSKKRWWRIGPSRVDPDPRFKDKPLGLGVFTTRPIKVRIFFCGEFICKTKTTVWERDYGIETDFPNYIITPTDSQIRTGNLKYYWRINHDSAVVFPVTLPPAVLLTTVIGLGCWNGDDESMMVKRERERAVRGRH